MEQLVRQGARAVLDGAGQTVRTGKLAEPPQHVEVELHLGDAATGQRHAAVARAGLDADLADRLRAGAALQVGIDVGAQLLLGRVLLANLADLAADADRHASRLQRTDQTSELRGVVGVHLLLLGHRRPGEVHQRRGVDVDVQEPGRDRLTRQIAQAFELVLGIRCPLRGVELEVIALQEHRRPPPLAQRGGQDDGGVLGRALVGVGHLALGDLEDDRAGIPCHGRRERLPRGEVGRRTHVDRGDGELRHVEVAAAPGAIQVVDRRGAAAERLGCAPDHPASGVTRCRIGVEHGLEDELIHQLAAQRGLIVDVEASVGDGRDAIETGAQIGRGGDAHGLNASEGPRRG